jgi:hypothetical protein
VSINRREEDGIRRSCWRLSDLVTRNRDLSTSGVAGTFDLEHALGATDSTSVNRRLKRQISTSYFNVTDGDDGFGR